ncbi:transglutaminase [Shinella sp. AETb1-6]|uniref:transglutaminase-like cysteine peptidase n=1 Tax=Shinella sp. AETb1-6 TaxID=2692210 RepID=UPI0013697E80|nr:transglutaminase [Shinella sp. AETb1-6]
MYPRRLLRVSLVLCAIGVFSPAQASPSMPVGAATSQPVGHFEFCRRHPTDCRPTRIESPIHLTQEIWKTVVRINASVNVEIDQRSDMEVWGYEDYWEYPFKGAGDCDDIVLEKRRRLIEAGLPVSNLLITVVKDERGDGHAVLTVRTDRGDFILDNMKAKIFRWDETPYVYLKRQSTKHAGKWVDIAPSGPSVIANRDADQNISAPATTRRNFFDAILGR